MNILILNSQVPFVRGGAEVLVEGLAGALSDARHNVDIVDVPISWNPPEHLLTTALAWRLLDLSSFNGMHVDQVICTKFPTWVVNHPRKALWLIHQHRQAYDLYGTAMSEFRPDAQSQTIRNRVFDIDTIGIGACNPRYAISKNVADRLRRFARLDAMPLYPPVPRAGLTPIGYEPFILSVARLDAAKRVAEIVRAWRFVASDLRLVIAGDGPERERIEALVVSTGLQHRVTILGRVNDATLLDLYNTCRAVYYAPIDEDYGYTTVEALAAGKPVITAADSGGVLEFIRNGETGIVTSLEARILAEAIDVFRDESTARILGSSGPTMTDSMTWDTVVDALTAQARPVVT